MRRLALALLLSLVCHLVVLGALRRVRLQATPVRPLVVTMLGGGDDEGGGTAPPAPVEAARAPAAVVAVPVAAPRVVTKKPVEVRRPVERERPAQHKAVTSVPAVAAPAAPIPAPPGSATRDGTGRGEGTAATVATGDGNGTGTGAGSGHGTRGTGGAGGSDGLRAFCASCPAPEYPSRARRQGWQGTVDVELAIAPDGRVQDVRVGRSSGYPALDDVALDVARRSRFTVPAGGDELRGQLRYRFVLDATAASR